MQQLDLLRLDHIVWLVQQEGIGAECSHQESRGSDSSVAVSSIAATLAINWMINQRACP